MALGKKSLKQQLRNNQVFGDAEMIWAVALLTQCTKLP